MVRQRILLPRPLATKCKAQCKVVWLVLRLQRLFRGKAASRGRQRQRKIVAALFLTFGTASRLFQSIYKTVSACVKAGQRSLSVDLAETFLGSCAFRIGPRHRIWIVTSVPLFWMILKLVTVSLMFSCLLVTFLAWKWANLAPMYLKRHLQHDSMSFFLLGSRFTTFCLGMRTNQIFWPFRLFSFPYLFNAVVDLLLSLLPVEWAFLCLSSLSSSL